MTEVLVSVGSNREDPVRQVQAAREHLANLFSNVQMSPLYLTEPVGEIVQDTFVNAAIIFETNLSAPEVLESLLEVETRAGRDRNRDVPKGPRTLDLDLILFGNEIWNTDALVIPHPRFRERRFVLTPAVDIAGDMIDPMTGKSLVETLQGCRDINWINLMEQKVLV